MEALEAFSVPPHELVGGGVGDESGHGTSLVLFSTWLSGVPQKRPEMQCKVIGLEQ